MRESGLAPDPGEENGVRGRGNSTHNGLEGVCPGKNGRRWVEMLLCMPLWQPCSYYKVGRGRIAKGLECREEQSSREGSLVKEDMSGVRRRVEWLRAGTLESVSLGSNPSSPTSSLCDLGQITPHL